MWKQQQPTAPTCRASLSLWVSLPGPAQCHFGPYINTHTHTLTAEFNLVHSPCFLRVLNRVTAHCHHGPAVTSLPQASPLWLPSKTVCARTVCMHLICIHVHTELFCVTEELCYDCIKMLKHSKDFSRGPLLTPVYFFYWLMSTVTT